MEHRCAWREEKTDCKTRRWKRRWSQRDPAQILARLIVRVDRVVPIEWKRQNEPITCLTEIHPHSIIGLIITNAGVYHRAHPSCCCQPPFTQTLLAVCLLLRLGLRTAHEATLLETVLIAFLQSACIPTCQSIVVSFLKLRLGRRDR